MDVLMVFLGWSMVVSKEFKFVVLKEFKVVYFSSKYPNYKFSRLFSCDEQLKK